MSSLRDPTIIIRKGKIHAPGVHALWVARIPYIPEHSAIQVQENFLAGQKGWYRLATAVSQLPSEKQLGFDLRFKFVHSDEEQARIEVAIIGRGSADSADRTELDVARENAQFAWRALLGLFPSEYPLVPLVVEHSSENEIDQWLKPYGDTPGVVEVHKFVSKIRGDNRKPLPYNFRPSSVSMIHPCHAMLDGGKPCLLSIAIAPAKLNKNERGILNKALISARLDLPSPEQRKPLAQSQMLYNEIQEVIQDSLEQDHLPITTPRNLQVDPQLTSALVIYYQLLSAGSLIMTRISVASPESDYAYEIAHALGADLVGNIESSDQYTLVGYDIVDTPVEKLQRHLEFATTLPDNDEDRISVLCTPLETTAAFRLPDMDVAQSWIGIPTKPINPFKPIIAFSDGDTSKKYTSSEFEQGNIRLGEVIDDTPRRSTRAPYKLDVSDLTQHVLLVGGTGSGKTTTGLHIINEVRKILDTTGWKVRVLLIDPVKTELRPLIRDLENNRRLLVFSTGSQFSPLYIDAFRVPDGVSPEQHLQILVACFSAAFPMGGPLELLLTRSMRDVYKDLYGPKLDIPLRPRDPRPVTPSNILHYIACKASKRIKTYVGDIRGNLTAAVQHRLEWLAEGIVGRVIVPRAGDRVLDIDTLLENDILIELKILPGNEEKSFVMAILLALLGEYYAYSVSARGEISDTGGRLRHLTWIDEAQRLFTAMSPGSQDPEIANARGKAIELFVELLSEMRSRGEGLIVSTQLPSMLDPRVRKHPSMKIMHRLTPEDDRSVLGATMDLNEDQLRFVTRLQAGEAAVFRGQFPAAVLVKVPDIRSRWAEMVALENKRTAITHQDWLRATYISDKEIENYMQKTDFGHKHGGSEYELIFEGRINAELGNLNSWRQNARIMLKAPFGKPCAYCRPLHETGNCLYYSRVVDLLTNPDIANKIIPIFREIYPFNSTSNRNKLFEFRNILIELLQATLVDSLGLSYCALAYIIKSLEKKRSLQEQKKLLEFLARFPWE